MPDFFLARRMGNGQTAPHEMCSFARMRQPVNGRSVFSLCRNRPAAAPQEGSVISLHVENDMFVGDDDNYTSGVRIGWMSGTTAESRTFSGMLGTVLGGTNASDSWRRFMGMNGSSNLRQQWGLDLTQLMFTPERKLREPIYGEASLRGQPDAGSDIPG